MLLIALTAVAAAQSARIGDTVLHGRRAGGGFIGEVRFTSSDPKKNLNVMRDRITLVERERGATRMLKAGGLGGS